MTVAVGVIVGWPGTAASIPSGWNRVTGLDGRYLKEIADSTTEPGTEGGSSTHSHSTQGHDHTVGGHSHSQGDTSSASSGVGVRSTGQSDTGASYRQSHVHGRPSTGTSSSGSSGSAAPDTDTASNEATHKKIIWIESDGTPDGIPVGAVTLWGEEIVPDGWETEDEGETPTVDTYFLRGADAAGDGSKSKVTVTHDHEVASHTHTGHSHGHSSSSTLLGPDSYRITTFGGTGADRTSNAHSHSISISSAESGALQSGSGGTVGSGPADPPFRRINVIENTTAEDLPIGTVGIWLGSLAAIPVGWRLCDGTGGTPNLCGGRYPRYKGELSIGAIGGGSHTHASPLSHDHSSSGHSHSVTLSQGSSGAESDADTDETAAQRTHTHSASNTDSATPSITNTSPTVDSESTEPLHTEVAFIMWFSFDFEPVPPPGQALKGFGGQIEIRVEVDTPFLDSGTFAVYDTSIYGTATYGAKDPEWTNVTGYLLEAEVEAGRERWEQRFEAGTGQFTLDNTEGIWTPDTNLPTPWYLPWRPGRRIRITAIPDPTTDPDLPASKHPLWTGEVDSATDAFGEGAYDLTTVVQATDLMARLARINPPALETPTGVQTTHARVNAALDRADWPMDKRDIQDGEHTMQSSHLAQTVLEECQAAAEAEGGAFFITADGVATFKNRDWLSTDTRSVNTQIYIGYEQIPDVIQGAKTAHILDIQPSWETARIRNDIQLARTGGSVYQTEDSASIGLFDRRSYRRLNYQNNAQSEIQFLADRFLVAWKDNRYRVDSVKVMPNIDPDNEDLNRLFWDSRFGDLLSLLVRTGHGWEYEVLSTHIMGIVHRFLPDDWIMTLKLDDSETFQGST